MSKHSIRNGASGSSSASCSATQRPGPRVVIRRALELVAAERLLRVAGDRLEQLALRPPLRHPDPHLGSLAGEREELLVELALLGLDRHEHLARHVVGRRVAVELLEDAGDEVGLVDVLDLVDDEALAPGDPAAPHVEHLHRRFELVLGEPDDVEVLLLRADHLLALDDLAHREQLVPQPRRAFEVQRLGRLVHLLLEPVEDRRGLTVEKGDQLVDQARVLLVVDRADARRDALLDVRVEARPAEPLVALELVVRAGADRERPQQQVEGLADRVRVGERPEVADALALLAPHHHRPRPLLAHGHREERIRLVVLQPDVEPRLVRLDELVLEEERLDLVAHLDPLDRLGRRHHLAGARQQRRRGAEVVGQPAAQALRLADVDDPAVLVLELVRARGVGDRSGGRTGEPSPPLLRSPGKSFTHRSGAVCCIGGRSWLFRPHIGSEADNPAVWRPGCPRRPVSEPFPRGGTHMLRLQAPLPDRYTLAGPEQLRARIAAAKAELGSKLLILGHHYQRDEVIEWADMRGDSFKLARFAADNTEATDIVFCGVHFMAESADVLTGDHQRVVLPDLNAGCSMADMANLDQVEEAWDELAQVADVDRIVPVTYMNSSAALKAFVGEHGGAVCTSSNARAILEWALDRGDKVLFFPDQHLGRNTALAMGHDRSDDERVEPARGPRWARGPRGQGGHLPALAGLVLRAPALPPGARGRVPRRASRRAQVLVHPECSNDVVQVADRVGSTERILEWVDAAPAGAALGVATEIHMVQRMARENPDKTVVSLDPLVCPCSTMFRIDAPHLAWVLDALVSGEVVNQITVDPHTAEWARLALQRMLDIT